MCEQRYGQQLLLRSVSDLTRPQTTDKIVNGAVQTLHHGVLCIQNDNVSRYTRECNYTYAHKYGLS
jgi:hypothetical protein